MYKWEAVSNNMYRFKIPEGWLYKEVRYYDNTQAPALVFVPAVHSKEEEHG